MYESDINMTIATYCYRFRHHRLSMRFDGTDLDGSGYLAAT